MARLYGPGPGDPPPLIPTGDLAGLRTTDVEDRPVGQLFGSLSEERTGLIRYLDVELEGAGKHVLVPIGHTRIDNDSIQPRVRLRAATYEDLLDVPDYDPAEHPVDPSYQDRLLEAHGRLFYGAYYYAHPAYDHTALYAGDSPIMAGPGLGDGPDRADGALLELSALGRSVARDDDVRGLPVDDTAGEAVGTVAELLVEVGSGRPRYALVDLETPARRAVLPVGYLARVEQARLRARDLTRDDIVLLPPYEPPFSREAENRLLAALDGRLAGERYFHRPDFRGR
jgi:hypothetical protein